jgi:hypothetical protein
MKVDNENKFVRRSPVIGCVPNAPGFRHPADRRRYLVYFHALGIAYEEAVFETAYTAVHVSIAADLTRWVGYKKAHTVNGVSPHVIFDLSDSYLAASPLMDWLRPAYYYFSGRNHKWRGPLSRSIRQMIDESDVILCGSVEQKEVLAELHPKVLVMRDFFDADIRSVKRDYTLVKDGELHVLWEGFAHGSSKASFKMLYEILRGLKRTAVHLHVVTDPTCCAVGGRILCRPTYSMLKRIFGGSGVHIHVYDWNITTFSSIASACDLALIPIPNDPIMQAKPENKLLLLWSVGLPVITSATASYRRVLQAVGSSSLACGTLNEWLGAIELVAASPTWRESHMAAARQYLARHCSKDVILGSWQGVFESALS